jgi:hypothetical protein
VPPDAAPAAARDAKRAEGLEVVLDGCACCWLTSNVCLLGLRSGAMLMLQLKHEGTKMMLKVGGPQALASGTGLCCACAAPVVCWACAAACIACRPGRVTGG